MDMSSIAANYGPLIIGVLIAIIMFSILYSFKPIVAIGLYTFIGFAILFHYLEGIVGNDAAQWIIFGIIVLIIILYLTGIARRNARNNRILEETTGRKVNFAPKFRFLTKEELFSGGENTEFFRLMIEKIRNSRVDSEIESFMGYEHPENDDQEAYNELSYKATRIRSFESRVNTFKDVIMRDLVRFCSVQYPDFPVWEPYRDSYIHFFDEAGYGSKGFDLKEALDPSRFLSGDCRNLLNSFERGRRDIRSFESSVEEVQKYHKVFLVIESDPEKLANLLPADWKIKSVLTKCYWASPDEVKDYMETHEILL